MAPSDASLPLAALVNGAKAASVSIADRGLHYGDGLFETIAIRDGAPCLWEEHLARLRLGAGRLAIPMPAPGLLLAECLALAQGLAAGLVKLILTRGSGGRGYRPPPTPLPNRLLLLYPRPTQPAGASEAGVAVRWCRTVLGENPQLAGIKHLNRLEQVLARAEWDADADAGACAEGLMCDCRGRVIAGTMTNVFVYAGDRLLTPRLDSCGVAGTVRGVVLRLAPQLGIKVAEVDLRPADLHAASGLFLTNAVIGVWPVRALGVQEYAVGHLPQGLIAAVRAAVRVPLVTSIRSGHVGSSP
jgi:4-amino-4-deoxychorismate lyase